MTAFLAEQIQTNAASLRPVQIWVLDARRPTFAQECSRQAKLAAVVDANDSGLDDWMDAALSDVDGWVG